MVNASEAEFVAAGNHEFPWSYLRQSVRERLEVWSAHSKEVSAIVASPDGRTIASGDDWGEIRLWDVATGLCRRLVPEQSAYIRYLGFSPDGQTLASIAGDASGIDVWDVASGRFRETLKSTEHEGISTFLFSMDGTRLAGVGCDPGNGRAAIACWNPGRHAGSVAVSARTDDMATASFLNDARILSLVKLMENSARLAPGDVSRLKRSWIERAPRGIAQTPDRSMGIVASGDGTFDIYHRATRWRMAAGRIHGKGTAILVFDSRDFSDRVQLDELARVESLVERLAAEPVNESEPDVFVRPWITDCAAAFSPDGRRLAYWHKDKESGLSVVDLTTGLVSSTYDLGTIDRVRAMTFTPDGQTLAFGSYDGKVRLWHLYPAPNPLVLRGHSPKEAWSITFSPDGQTLASGGDDNRIRLWNVETGEEKAVLRAHYALVSAVRFSPDGRTLASGSFDTKAHMALWDVGTATLRNLLKGHGGSTRAIAFSPDGLLLASGGDDGRVILWDVNAASPKATLVQQRLGVICMAFHPNGRTIVSSNDHEIVFTDAVRGGRRSFDTGTAGVTSLVYSHDGSQLTTGHIDGLIKTWDAATGRHMQTLPGHSGYVFGLAFSPDGCSLASAGMDRTVRLWDAATGHELLCLNDCKDRVHAVAFSPNGGTLAAVDHSGAITLWHASSETGSFRRPRCRTA